jgi:DNA-directed RNA polymerase specialized sigma24 family protein
VLAGPKPPDGHDKPEKTFLSDIEIEMLLVSIDPQQQLKGYECLYHKKMDPIFRYLRFLSNQRNWRLSGDDVAEIWQETMLAIWKNVRMRSFRATTALNAYVRKIAELRAISFLRRRRRRIIPADGAIPLFEDPRFDEPHEEVIEQVHKYLLDQLDEYAKGRGLDEFERLVVRHFVRFQLHHGHDSDDNELAEWMKARVSQRDCKKKITVNAVRMARRSAFKKLFNEGGSQ